MIDRNEMIVAYGRDAIQTNWKSKLRIQKPLNILQKQQHILKANEEISVEI